MRKEETSATDCCRQSAFEFSPLIIGKFDIGHSRRDDPDNLRGRVGLQAKGR